MVMLPFQSVPDFAANFRKIERKECDFGGKLTHSLTHALTQDKINKILIAHIITI